MKTSNKILFTIFSVLLVSLMVIAGFNIGRATQWKMHWQGIITGKSNIVTQTSSLPQFNKVNLAISSNTTITASDKPQIIITCDKNLLSYLDISVTNHTLNIRTLPNTYGAIKRPTIKIFTAGLQQLTSGGDSTINVQHVDDKLFKLILNGSGNAHLEGHTQDLSIKINGSGKVYAENLPANNVKVVIKGNGKVITLAKDYLDVDIFGNGAVVYHGAPKKMQQTIRGSGEIIQQD